MLGFILCVSIAGLASAVSGLDCPNPTARIENGLVIGTTTSLPAASATVNKFLGIPFAQSPPERFSPPRAAPYVPTINATAWKPACIQQFTCMRPHLVADPSRLTIHRSSGFSTVHRASVQQPSLSGI